MLTKNDINEDVMHFITNFRTHYSRFNNAEPVDQEETIRHLFEGGYCYYFAHILKLAFNRGEVCWAVPFGHMVWVDDNGVSYDIEGDCLDREFEDLVPEKHLTKHMISDFKHVPGVKYTPPTEYEIAIAYKKYKRNIITQIKQRLHRKQTN